MQKASLPTALRSSWGPPPEPSSKMPSAHIHYETQGMTGSISSSSEPIPTGHRDSSAHYPIHRISEYVSTKFIPSRQYSHQASSSTDITTLATIASVQMRTHQRRPKSKKPIKPRYTSSEADRLMLAEEVYIGPVKKRGRPLGVPGTVDGEVPNDAEKTVACSGATDFNEDVTMDGSLMVPQEVMGPKGQTSSSLDNSSTETGVSSTAPEFKIRKPRSTKSSPQEHLSPPFVTTPLVRPPRDPTALFPYNPSQPTSLLDILAYLSASSSSSDPSVQNAALLAALNAIDSTPVASGSSTPPEKPSNPALVSALKDLLFAVSKRELPAPISEAHVSQPRSSTYHRTYSPDDEVVILDKENVNPNAFRRRTDRDSKLSGSHSTAPCSTFSGSEQAFPSTHTNGEVYHHPLQNVVL